MEITSLLLASVGRFLIESPIYLVWLVGIVVAIIRWNRHPRISLLALIALVGSLIVSFITTIIYLVLPQQITTYNLVAYYNVVGVCSSLVYMVLWGLVLAAIFGWRTESK